MHSQFCDFTFWSMRNQVRNGTYPDRYRWHRRRPRQTYWRWSIDWMNMLSREKIQGLGDVALHALLQRTFHKSKKLRRFQGGEEPVAADPNFFLPHPNFEIERLGRWVSTLNYFGIGMASPFTLCTQYTPSTPPSGLQYIRGVYPWGLMKLQLAMITRLNGNQCTSWEYLSQMYKLLLARLLLFDYVHLVWDLLSPQPYPDRLLTNEKALMR